MSIASHRLAALLSGFLALAAPAQSPVSVPLMQRFETVLWCSDTASGAPLARRSPSGVRRPG